MVSCIACNLPLPPAQRAYIPLRGAPHCKACFERRHGVATKLNRLTCGFCGRLVLAEGAPMFCSGGCEYAARRRDRTWGARR